MSNSLFLKKTLIYFLVTVLTVLFTSCKDKNQVENKSKLKNYLSTSVTIYHDTDENSIVFAAEELAKVLNKKGVSIALKPLSSIFEETPLNDYFVIGKNSKNIQNHLKNITIPVLGEQEYLIQIIPSGNKVKGHWAIGGDPIGAMYGGIHLSEIVAGELFESIESKKHSPYISKRGLKLNIPLDNRTPSFDDGGVSANTNRDDVWDLTFWKEYFDVLARQRYNVISLWNLHPFPSLVNVPGYEDITLKGVLDKQNNVVNDWSIEEKIAFWNKVIDLAEDRGIEVWPVVWNVELHSSDGKHGISREKGNKPAKDYIRKAVTQMFIEYPKLAGIGVTAGEKMNEYTDSEKEQWVWDTYGEGVMDAKKLFPNRNIRFVHRHWLTDWKEIESRFSALPDGFELALKYAQARLYSHTKPSWATTQLSEIPKDMATWWNLRNDDIYVQRWGDPDYVKDYILNFPHKSKPCSKPPCLTAGYIMGSDRFFWARESMSKNPQSPPQLENEKHWYKFLLWGRLGYDPNTSNELLKGLIKYRFPSINETKIFEGWKAASKTIPIVNKFHYWNWDYFWWVERGTGNEWSDIDGYHNINHIIVNGTQDVSGYLNIKDFVKNKKSGISPLKVADSLEYFGNKALSNLIEMKDNGNIELKETLGDIRSQAYFGIYWAHKIRGGVELEFYRQKGGIDNKNKAISHLKKSLESWKNYAQQLEASYKKVNFAGHHVFDWDALISDVEKDIQIAEDSNYK